VQPGRGADRLDVQVGAGRVVALQGAGAPQRNGPGRLHAHCGVMHVGIAAEGAAGLLVRAADGEVGACAGAHLALVGQAAADGERGVGAGADLALVGQVAGDGGGAVAAEEVGADDAAGGVEEGGGAADGQGGRGPVDVDVQPDGAQVAGAAGNVQPGCGADGLDVQEGAGRVVAHQRTGAPQRNRPAGPRA